MQGTKRRGIHGATSLSRHKGTALLIALLFVGLALGALPAAWAQSKHWPGFQNDAKNSGVATGSTLETPLKQAWQQRFPAGHQVKGSPVIAGGSVVVASTEGMVRAYDTETATMLWSYDAGERVEGTPAIDNEWVFVATYNSTTDPATGKLIKINLETGAVDKTVTLEAGSWGGPTIHGGILAVGHDKGKVAIYETTAMTKLREFTTELTDNKTLYPAQAVRSSPIIYDNVLYFGSFNKIFFAVDLNSAEEIWLENVKDVVFSSGAIDPEWTGGQVDGAVYIGSYNGLMYALDLDKDTNKNNCPLKFKRDAHPKTHNCPDIVVFRYDAGAPIHSSPAIANGKVYFGDNNGVVHAVPQTNTYTAPFADWTYATDNGVFASPAVIGRSIVVGSYDDHLYVFTEDSEGELVGDPWKIQLSDKIHASPAIADREVFVVSQDGVLYKFVDAKSDAPIIEPGSTGVDLVIDSVLSTPRKPVEGQPIEFAVTITNSGGVDSGPFTVRFYSDDALVEEQTAELAAGTSSTVTFKLLVAPANMNIKFIVDEDGLVVESNEDNNVNEQSLSAGEGTGDEGDPVVVDDPSGANDTGDESDEDVPGPGLLLSLVSLGLLGSAVGRHRRR